ncbi:hypothetical protein [Ktedonobacter robiniae]|uniref:Uncharacterized protein n=1 Tax=Ktedonobacter robiniae TaxID=2778365 RepID=A0ABQ3V0J7_9CHLR|nr:hypothetical protein [Ktedonobacter robiniae]GHO58654.1 hypothetical protein KSB_71290 [Ktedonobacter robiniae]
MKFRKLFISLATFSLLLVTVLALTMFFAANHRTLAAGNPASATDNTNPIIADATPSLKSSPKSSPFVPKNYHFQHKSQPQQQGKKAPSDLATWTSSFDYNGTTYPYTMVGTDPKLGSATTTIPVKIVPLKVVIGSNVFDGSNNVHAVINSPLFSNTSFATGDTQYTDAIQRGSFWNTIQQSSPDYHVLLGKPKVEKEVTINVDASHGGLLIFSNSYYGNIGDINWWDGMMQQLLQTEQASPNELTIFLSYDVLIQGGVGGYHSTTGQGVSGDTTYAWSSYFDPYLFSGFSDVAALSHELSEWMSDPYTNNTVPTWSVPNEPQYGCSPVLEDGDPLVGTIFKENGYTLQDEAFFSWFARQSPSIGYQGNYSYLDTFKSYSSSDGC